MEQLKNERWHILEKLIMELERLNQNMTLKGGESMPIPGMLSESWVYFFQLPFVFLLDGLL